MDNRYYAKMALPCKEIGRALACSSDEEQAEVINSFASELKVVCRDSELTGIQVCYMSKNLSADGEKLIESMYEYIQLRKNDNG